MLTLEQAACFRRDYKRELRGPYRREVEKLLSDILERLVADAPLPSKNKDHVLTGNWFGYRECHLKPDLLLIYKKTDDNTLRLARLGSHSEIFG